MENENRTEAREQVSLPMKLDGGLSLVTRDVSASGLFLETSSEQRAGNLIDIEIDFDTPCGPLKLKAQGRIVRLELHGSRTGVGVKLPNSRLEPVARSI